jgi:hypothetical protein
MVFFNIRSRSDGTSFLRVKDVRCTLSTVYTEYVAAYRPYPLSYLFLSRISVLKLYENSP